MASKLFFKYFSLILLVLCEIILDIVFAIKFQGFVEVYFLLTSILAVIILSCVNFVIKKKELLVPWFVVFLFFPLVGSVLYFVFCGKIISSNKVKKKIENEKINDEKFSQTKAKYYAWGKDFFEDVKKQIKKAKKYVFFEFYILEYGKLFDELIEVVKEKIENGVEVFMLIDEIGSLNRLPKNFLTDMKNIGVKCQKFQGLTSGLLHNNRDHRKIVVVDGDVAFLGGVNLADEYVGKKQKYGIWKDGGVRVEGEVARDFAKSFCAMFSLSSKNIRCPKIDEDKCERILGDGLAKSLFFTPSCVGEKTKAECEIISLLDEAKTEIKISTPYFIPDDDIQEALQRACDRGVRVTIFVPGIADKKLVNLVTKSYYQCQLERGIEIFEFEKGFIHSKNILIDDSSILVGTINLDYRSFFRNFECGVIVKNSQASRQLADDFSELEKSCKKIEPKDLPKTRLLIKILRFFAPIL